MLRGALIWLGLCVCIVVLWRLAEAASGEERMLPEADAAGALAAAPDESVSLGAAARPAPRWHECEYQPMDCDELRCDRRAASTYSRFQ